MKRLAVSLLAILAFSLPAAALAHDLIPVALQEFVEQNPGATPEEIRAFADAQAPGFASRFRDGVEIANAVRDRETSALDTFLDFARIGVEHILSGPDHVLFVLSLLLVFVGVREVLRLTAAFTVAHSITLALSGLGILTLSPRVTEPLIALSIAYMAITSVFLRRTRFFGAASKPFGVFFFGLFHGLGFAGLLQELSIPREKFLLSLLSFNVGIEIGQLLIVAAALPLIYLLRKKAWYPVAVKVAAACIAVLACVWVVQRIVG